jgi:hypothetical protein
MIIHEYCAALLAPVVRQDRPEQHPESTIHLILSRLGAESGAPDFLLDSSGWALLNE